MTFIITGAALVVLIAAYVWSERIARQKGRKALDSKASLTIIVVALVISAAASQFLLAPQLVSLIHRYSMQQEMMNHKLFRAIRQHSPAEYERQLDRFVQRRANPDTAASAHALLGSELAEYALTRIPLASNEAATQFNRALVESLRELRPMPRDACYRYLFPGAEGSSASLLSAASQSATMAALAAVVTSAASDSARPPAASEILPAFQYMIIPLEQKYGTDWQMLADAQSTQVNRDRVCEMTLDLYESILAMPPGQNGLAFRYVFML